MMMGAADIIAALCVRLSQQYISTKKGFIASYLWVFVITVIYLFIQNITVLIPFTILLMRLGITFAFGLSYFGNSEYFPAMYLSTVFGMCNVFARMSTIFSPMAVEVVPQPILLISVLSLTAAITSSFLSAPQKEGSFASSGKKGKIEFVQDSAVEGKDFEQANADNQDFQNEEIKKEVFLLEDDENEENSQTTQEGELSVKKNLNEDSV